MQSSEPKSDSHSFSPMTSRAVRSHNRSVGTDRLEQIGWGTDRLEQIGENRDGPERERNKKSSQRNNPDRPQHSSRLHDVSMRS
jgi:hypothetical protein